MVLRKCRVLLRSLGGLLQYNSRLHIARTLFNANTVLQSLRYIHYRIGVQKRAYYRIGVHLSERGDLAQRTSDTLECSQARTSLRFASSVPS